MHELGIMYHVVQRVLKVVEANGLVEVEAIVLQAGELSGVVPRYLHACFPAAVDGTMLQSARLEVELLRANALCGGCGKVFGALEHKEGCPYCGAAERELISGHGFYIKEIRAC